MLRNQLDRLTSSFGNNIKHISPKLTYKEIEISSMIENGLMSEEISKLLNISCKTVERHRHNIRKKLGIVRKNINLRTYLNQFQS